MHLFSRIARTRSPWALIFLISLSLNAAITAMTGVPGPETHDEFSYLLAADTFAHGRLTNPPHPFWQHFESFHILQQPTYQSKYQPAQGLILAVGQALTGLPIVGSWLSAAMAALLIGWALSVYLPRRWAVLGGMMAAFHPLLLLWGQNYWGGSVPAIGGALVFGAAGRLACKPSVKMAGVLGLGVVVLFNSRPYEGLIFALLVMTPLLWTPALRKGVVWITLGSVSVAAAGWSAYYDYRVTGSAFQLPYLVYEREYALAPPFLWESLRPAKTYRHDSLREYNVGTELSHFEAQRSVIGLIAGIKEKIVILARSYGAEPVLLLGIAGLPWAMRRHRTRVSTVMLMLFMCGLMLSNWTFPHYAAPAFGLLLLPVIDGLRRVAAGRRWILRIFIAFYAAFTICWVIYRSNSYPESWGRMRQMLIAELLDNPGDDLVIVHYEPGRNINTEWVFNRADIDHSPIVWAQDMGAEKNAELIHYFKGRKIWLLDVGPNRTTHIDPYDQWDKHGDTELRNQ